MKSQLSHPINKRTWIYSVVFGALSAFALFESLNYHSLYRDSEWRGENFADAGGYYSHLLMWFDKGYESKSYPTGTDQKFGFGFSTEQATTIKTKYTCGVAYLQAPFYLGNRLLGNILQYDTEAASLSNKKMIDYAAAFYLWAGALCLFLFLTMYFRKNMVFILLILTILGTNIFFYAIYHPGMSHIYSFFLTSLYLLSAAKYLRSQHIKWICMLALAAAIIVLIRPTNILILPIVFFLDGGKKFVQLFKKTWVLLASLCIIVVVWIPQFIYWFKVSGSILHYSYNNESFSNWLNPQIRYVLFAPDNGMLLYNPFIIFLVAAAIWGSFRFNRMALFYCVLFIAVVYLSASWHAPSFGCSYGQRNFVELHGVGLFSLCLLFENWLKTKKYILLVLFLTLIPTSIGYTIKIMNKYNHCSFAASPWDWNQYWYYLSNDKLIVKENYNQFYDTSQIIEINSNKVLQINENNEETRLLSAEYYKCPINTQKGIFSMKIKSNEPIVNFDVMLKIAENDTVYFDTRFIILNQKVKPQTWVKIRGVFNLVIPYKTPRTAGIYVYLYNRNKKQFLIDNAKLLME